MPAYCSSANRSRIASLISAVIIIVFIIVVIDRPHCSLAVRHIAVRHILCTLLGVYAGFHELAIYCTNTSIFLVLTIAIVVTSILAKNAGTVRQLTE